MKVRAISKYATSLYKVGEIYEVTGETNSGKDYFLKGVPYTCAKHNFQVVEDKVKELFGGKITVLKDYSEENNKALIKLLEGHGYTEYADTDWIGESARVAVGGDVGGSLKTGLKYWRANFTGENRQEKTLAEFIQEIYAPEKPKEVTVELSNGYTATVKKTGEVKVGCYNVTVTDAQDIIKVWESIQEGE